MAAPVWRLGVFKSLGAEQWANEYLLDNVTISEAATVADLVVSWEQDIHRSNVMLDYYILSSVAEGDRIFRHVPLNLPGLDPIGAEDYLPLYNTVRMDMATTDSDPCRKYYRLPIAEGQQSNGILTVAFRNAFNAAIIGTFQAILDLDSIVSSTGKTAISASVHANVQMRQLHRRRRKKILVGGVLV